MFVIVVWRLRAVDVDRCLVARVAVCRSLLFAVVCCVLFVVVDCCCLVFADDTLCWLDCGVVVRGSLCTVCWCWMLLWSLVVVCQCCCL